MTPYVTLLERCGHDYYEVEPGVWGQRCDGLMDNPKIFFGDELKAYALEVGARKCAGYLSGKTGVGIYKCKEGCSFQWASFDSCGEITRAYSNLELIQEATKAGWEKGEGL